MMKTGLLFLLVLLISVSCKTYNDDDRNSFDLKIKKYISKSGKHFERSESGLYYRVIKEGEGTVIRPMDEVEFTYIGKLLNGKIFDSEHVQRTVKFKVPELIMAWQEAMNYVHEGGRIELISPPSLGYGDYDLERIPKNSILHFELQIHKVR